MTAKKTATSALKEKYLKGKPKVTAKTGYFTEPVKKIV